ncbi:MAG: DUF1071 domain-containing protein [Bacteroidaceae bacterium]|nr:DUF1071 domain-containing protein [Bacteroidaceae bacterium]
MSSTFETLNAINVNDKTERKNGLTYLSWAWAWQEIKKVDPKANYTIYENAMGWNYFTDGNTAWVKTGVVIDGLEHIEYLPIMDYKNKSIPADKITSFDVNKAIQRSLTKACARHGLGLYIYAGEDLPESEMPVIGTTDNEKKAEIKKLIQQTDTDTVVYLLAMSKHFKKEFKSVDEMQGAELDYALMRIQEKARAK